MIHYRTCPLCEAMCGLAITVKDGQVARIAGDADDPFSRGYICPKASALADIHTDPDRLRRPLRRTATGWEELPWDEALEAAAAGLMAVRERHGADAIAVYQGNPTVHNMGSVLFAGGVVRALGTKRRYSATSVDQLPHQFASYWMFGHQLLLPVPDIDHTDHWLILGANPAVSNGSLMSAPDVKRRLLAIKERGGSVVVVDPRRTETAALASAHHFIRPGGDVYLLLALLHVIYAENLAAPGRLEAWTDGLERIPALVAPYPPERVAAHIGIAADAIRIMARDFAAAPSAVAYGRIGTSLQPFGALATWLTMLLNLVTGNLDSRGGAMFTTPAFDFVAQGGRGSWDRWRSRVRGRPEFAGELPAATLAEDMEAPGPDQIRALVVSAGNPVLSTPDGRRLERALAGLEYMVAVDFYLNETTRHAQIILPPTGPLEHSHYDVTFNMLAIRNVARYDEALFAPPEDTRHDWEILQELAARIAGGAAKAPYPPERLLERGLRSGPWREQASLETLRATRRLDLGPLEPRFPDRLGDRRIDACPAILVADLARAEAALDAPPPDLALIGRRQLRSNNSWMHNSQRLVKGPERCVLLMHPVDATRHGLADGQRVHVASAVGAIEVPLALSDDLMPGVVSLPHGWGHNRAGLGLRVAAAHPGASINDITDGARIDELSGNAALNGIPVTVTAAK